MSKGKLKLLALKAFTSFISIISTLFLFESAGVEYFYSISQFSVSVFILLAICFHSIEKLIYKISTFIIPSFSNKEALGN
jgi:hypothetical protein